MPRRVGPDDMPLTLRPAGELDQERGCDASEHFVQSGELVVGTISRLPEGKSQGGLLAWKLVLPMLLEAELLERHGIARDLTEATAKIKQGFGVWLKLTHLEEADHTFVRAEKYRELSRNAKAALNLIREALEQQAPPGSVPGKMTALEPREDWLFWEADAIVKGIAALGGRKD